MVGSNYRLPAHLKAKLGARVVPCVKCGQPSLPNLTWCRDCQTKAARKRAKAAHQRQREAQRRAKHEAEQEIQIPLVTGSAPTRNAPFTFEGLLRWLLPMRAQRAQYERRLAYHAKKDLVVTFVTFRERHPITDDETLAQILDADERLARIQARGPRRWAIKDRIALLAGTQKEGAS